MREKDDALISEDVPFPVASSATVIFVREFYDLFYTHFRDNIMQDATEPGVIFRGPPGVGKVK